MENTLLSVVKDTLSSVSWPVLIGTGLFAWLFGSYAYRMLHKPDPSLPPVVDYWIPFIGSMISFGMNPIKFLQENRAKYGDYFTFIMFGRRMTYCMGPDGNNDVFNAKLADANAEEAYASLTVPVFGEDVVYDVPNHVLMDQKRFVKSGFTPDAFRTYVPIIIKEVEDYFARWDKKEGIGNIHHDMARCIINTAAHCLMGREIRAMMDESVAGLYEDLDKGFTPLNFLFPYLPLPSYYRRDRAHAKMSALFRSIMENRRANNLHYGDMMDVLMSQHYKDGRRMTDKEVINLMIALLMAGQHTSSTTTTWAVLYLASNRDILEQVMAEQRKVLGDDLSTPLTYDHLRDMKLLDSVVRETLRLRPPILTVIRKVKRDMKVGGGKYTVPAGHYLGASPVVTQLDPNCFKDPERFYPARWLTTPDEEEGEADKDDVVDYGFGAMRLSGARNPYLPFGAGRHRCIGESFAYVQIKTILATFLRMFDVFEGPKGFPDMDFTSLIVMPTKPAQVRYRRRNL